MEDRHQNATNTMHYQVITCNISCGLEPPVVQKVDNAINRTIVFFNTYGSLHVPGKLPTYPSSKLTLTLTSHLIRGKCWLRGGVGGQFSRNFNWTGIYQVDSAIKLLNN